MSPVRPLVLKVVDEVADILVAELTAVSISKVDEDLPLKYGSILVVGLSTKHFEGQELVLVVVPAAQTLPVVSLLKLLY